MAHRGELGDTFAEVAGTSMDQGVPSVFAKGRAKAVLSLPVNAVYFFPGFHTLLHLTAAAAPPNGG